MSPNDGWSTRAMRGTDMAETIARLERENAELRNRAEYAEGYIEDATTSGGAIRKELADLRAAVERRTALLRRALPKVGDHYCNQPLKAEIRAELERKDGKS